MLPTYTRVVPSTRKSFHSREKCLIALIVASLCLLCFGGIFLLPDNFGSERVLKVYKQIQKAGPEIFIPAPPLAPHGLNSKEDDPHLIGDREKLQAKIKEELGEILDRPEIAEVSKISSSSNNPNLRNNNNYESQQSNGIGNQLQTENPIFHPNGEDHDLDIRIKRNKIKEVSYNFFLFLFLKY